MFSNREVIVAQIVMSQYCTTNIKWCRKCISNVPTQNV